MLNYFSAKSKLGYGYGYGYEYGYGYGKYGEAYRHQQKAGVLTTLKRKAKKVARWINEQLEH